MRRELAVLGALGVTAAGALAAYATRIEPYWLARKQRELVLPGLPAAFDGLTVLHLSDIHSRPGDPRGEAIVAAAASIPADLVCLTGDYGDRPRDAPIAAALLAAARGRLGTFAVLGNHDFDARPLGGRRARFSSTSANRVAGLLEARGIVVLRNESVCLERGDARLWIVGLDDPHTFRDHVPRAYEAIPAGERSIVLAHSWEPTALAAERGAMLVLAGHTHGGQVRPPWLPPIAHNTHRRPPRIGGLSWVDGTALYISRGLGATHRLRVLVRPEAVVFTLRSAHPTRADAAVSP